MSTATVLKKKQKTISRRNREFWAKARPQQRIAIAREVIKQLDLNFFNARRGHYLQFDLPNSIEIEDDQSGLDEILEEIRDCDGNCNVCGIGSIFLGMVILGDKVTANDVELNWIHSNSGVSDSNMRGMLRKIFTPIQLSLIESAFEQSGYEDGEVVSSDYVDRKIQKAVGFGGENGVYDSNVRLRAIMKNIIKNKGEFRP